MVGLEHDWTTVVEECDDPLAYRRAFKHFIKVGEVDEASRFLERGLKVFPNDTTLRLGRVELFRHQGKSAAAIAECRAILMDSPFTYPARDALAHLLVSEGLRDEAKQVLRLTEAEPDPSLSGQLHLAQLLAEDGDETESLALVEGYTGYQHLSGPGELEWLQALAKYALANNDLAKARDAMERLKSTIASGAT